MGLVGRETSVLAIAGLHRRVGLLISVAAAAVLVANLWTIPPHAQDWPIWRLILAPQVSLVGLAVHEMFTGLTLVRSLGIAVFVVGTLSMVGIKRARETNRRHELLETEVAEKTKELSTALADQKVLLMEVHHTTKNNLQLVSSLLSLETDSLIDDHEQVIEGVQSRIRALGRAHELLNAATPRRRRTSRTFCRVISLKWKALRTCGTWR